MASPPKYGIRQVYMCRFRNGEDYTLVVQVLDRMLAERVGSFRDVI